MNINTFKKILEIKVASHFLQESDAHIAFKLDYIMVSFDEQTMEWVTRCMARLDIDPQIVEEQTKEIIHLKLENDKLKKELTNAQDAVKKHAEWRLTQLKEDIQDYIEEINSVEYRP